MNCGKSSSVPCSNHQKCNSALPSAGRRTWAEDLDEETGEWIPTPEERAEIEAARAEYAAGDYRTFEEYDHERAAREQQ